MIDWRDGDDAPHSGSLFATFAALARGEAWSFPALRPHQREPWHAFTVQVAALALINAGRDDLPGDEAAWRDLLNGLTPDCPEAWMLVVDDWTKPALLQPPLVAATDRAAYKNRLPTPDALDMLVTAKNHDVKQERMAGGEEQEWLFALVTLQTSSAYGGAKTYGSSRMNGKTGSRLIARVFPSSGSSAAFQRDTRILVRAAAGEASKKALLWLEPNDGTSSLSIKDLAPSLYIDTARRIRLSNNEGKLEAHYATSNVARIAADLVAGLTGDPYAPVKDTGDASITPKEETFGYRGFARVLKSKLPLLAQTHSSDDVTQLSISMSALVRRGGTDTNTEGLHRREIRLMRLEQLSNGESAALDRVGDVAQKRAGEASEAGRRLRRALIALVQGGPDQARLDDEAANKKTEPWLKRFDKMVDDEFFDAPFWSEAAHDEGNHRMLWRTRLGAIASKVFDDAARAAPRTEVRRIRARARAQSMLGWQMAKWIKEVEYGE